MAPRSQVKHSATEPLLSLHSLMTVAGVSGDLFKTLAQMRKMTLYGYKILTISHLNALIVFR